jgi:hypothetical protein
MEVESFFEFGDSPAFFGLNEHDGCAFFPCAGSASAAVGVVVDLVWESEVNDEG